MIGAIQYRGVVGFPGQDVGSAVVRGKWAELEGSGFTAGRRAGGGSAGPSMRQQRDDRNRAWAALRLEVEALEEPERWDGLA